MQANWSLILNVLLLIGVVIAIARTLKARRQNTPTMAQKQPSQQPFIGGQGQPEKPNYDDIIAIRKVNRDDVSAPPIVQAATLSQAPSPVRQPSLKPASEGVVAQNKPALHAMPKRVFAVDQHHARHESNEALSDITSEHEQPAHQYDASKHHQETERHASASSSIMMFLLAKENRQLAGYELLQTVLAAGLRFGEGQLFHRHQYPNGQGPVLCSLAAATATGVFDLQNIGGFVVRGLCLFMQASGNPTIDAERFEIMLDTARQLSEGLDTYLLDEQRKPLSDASIERYHQRLNLDEMAVMD